MPDYNRIIVTDQKTIEQIIEKAVGEAMERKLPKLMRQATRKEYLTTNEFKELTGCSHRVQQYLRNENKIPYSQEGRKIFYRTSDVEKFMSERRIESK